MKNGWILSLLLMAVMAGCGQINSGEAAAPEPTAASPEPTAVLTPEGAAPVTAEPELTQHPTEEDDRMVLEVNGQKFPFTLADSDTAAAFAERLPAVWEMEELNGNEKFIYLDEGLPSAAEAVGQIEAGDLMLYGDSCVVLFYDSFSTPYSYTRIGRLEDPSGIAEAVGAGDVTVSFRKGGVVNARVSAGTRPCSCQFIRNKR